MIIRGNPLFLCLEHITNGKCNDPSIVHMLLYVRHQPRVQLYSRVVRQEYTKMCLCALLGA